MESLENINELAAKCLFYVGCALIALGILVCIVSLTVEETILYLAGGISTSVFGIALLGFSVIVKAAAIYISNNEAQSEENA